MTKTSTTSSAFPWGILVQVLILLAEVVGEATKKKR
jgi:hypothetical protein